MEPKPPLENDEFSQPVNLPIYTDVDKVPLNLLEQMSTHWKVMYEEKRRLHDVSIRQIVLGQIFTIVAVAAVAVIIEDYKSSLLLVGVTLLLYPALAGLLSSNAAVLGASIHHEFDVLPEERRIGSILLTLLRAIFVATMASALVGVIAGLVGQLFFDTPFSQTLSVATVAGLLTAMFGFPLLVLLTMFARHLKSNPDDVNAPFENVVFNILILLSIAVASRLLS